MAFRKISLERTSNNLACAVQCFLCLFLCTFCAAQNRSFKPKLNQKRSQNWIIFAKTQKFFAFFFWGHRLKSQILAPQPCPPFWKFFIKYIEKWRKTFCEKNGRPGRSTGDNFEIYRSGRVEKILTGSISDVRLLGRHWESLLRRACFAPKHHFQICGSPYLKSMKRKLAMKVAYWKSKYNIQKHFSASSVEKVACSLYIEWLPPIKNRGQWNQWKWNYSMFFILWLIKRKCPFVFMSTN